MSVASRRPGTVLVAEIDLRGVAETHQVRTTALLLRQAMNLSRGEAGMWVKQASEQAPRRDLTTGHPRPASPARGRRRGPGRCPVR